MLTSRHFPSCFKQNGKGETAFSLCRIHIAFLSGFLFSHPPLQRNRFVFFSKNAP